MTARSVKTQFWKWFEANKDLLAQLPKKKASKARYLWNELEVHLRALNRHLHAVIFRDQGSKKLRLTITAYGNSRYFKKAEELVAVAPIIKGWNIEALCQPLPVRFVKQASLLEMGIDIDQLFFRLRTTAMDQEDPELIVYCKEYGVVSEDTLYSYIEHIIMALVGERAFVELFRHFKLRPYYPDLSYKVYLLEELPAHMYRFSGEMVIDGEGKLGRKRA